MRNNIVILASSDDANNQKLKNLLIKSREKFIEVDGNNFKSFQCKN